MFLERNLTFGKSDKIGGIRQGEFIVEVMREIYLGEFDRVTLREKCPYSELFWSTFFPHVFPLGLIAGMQKNADQNNSKYGHFLRSMKSTRGDLRGKHFQDTSYDTTEKAS